MTDNSHQTEDRSLFPVPEQNPVQSTIARAMGPLVILVFLAICVSIGLVDALAPIEPQKLAGREKQESEERRANAKISDGTAMQLLETDMKRNSRVRSWSASRKLPSVRSLWRISCPRAKPQIADTS